MSYSRPYYQRVLALLLCLIFVCFFGLRISAEAVLTELAIAGVAVAGIALLASVAVICMGSAGLSEPMKTSSSNLGITPQRWMEDSISAYMTTEQNLNQQQVEAQTKLLCNGISYLKNGTIVVSNSFRTWFAGFTDWLIDNGDLVISGSGVNASVQSGDLSSSIQYPIPLTFGSEFIYRQTNALYKILVSGNSVVASFGLKGTLVYVFLASESAFSWGQKTTTNENDNVVMNQTSDTVNLNGKTFYIASINTEYYDMPYSTFDIIASTLSDANIKQLCYEMLFGATSTGATDGLDVWNDDTATDGLVLDPSGLLGDAVNDLAGYVANIGDYINTLADVIAGIGNPALPVIGLDIPVSIPIPQDIAIPVDPAIPEDVVGVDKVTGEEESIPPYVGTGDYTLDLTSFFPFCIPFDIYRMFSMFTSNPVAPSFDLPINYPGVINENIHIDLSDYDNAAAMLRGVEVIVFCLLLAAGTRKLLFGGG